MNGTDNASLLFDLAKLVRKHGPEAVQQLGILLSDPEYASELSRILREASTVGKQLNITPRKTDNFSRIKDRIAKQVSADPSRGLLLLKVIDLFTGRNELPLNTLRDYANRSGMPRIPAGDRTRVVTKLLSNLEGMPLDQLQSHVENLHRLSETGNGDRTLQGWADIILDNTRKKTG